MEKTSIYAYIYSIIVWFKILVMACYLGLDHKTDHKTDHNNHSPLWHPKLK